MYQSGFEYNIVLYRDQRGRELVGNFIQSFPQKIREKIEARIDSLQREGPMLQRPYADKISGKIYELRIPFGRIQVRILYCFMLRNTIVLLHGFKKKTSAIPISEIELAQRRMHDTWRRHQEGERMLLD